MHENMPFMTFMKNIFFMKKRQFMKYMTKMTFVTFTKTD